MEISIRSLTPTDADALWRINEEGLPGVGQVSSQALEALLEMSELSLGAIVEGRLEGFVICLLPGTSYGSPNYAWFNSRYPDFLYVDRIAVGQSARGLGLGTALYGRVIGYAEARSWPVAAEVSLEPPNPGSLRFHGRFGFDRVGELAHATQRVAMLLRAASPLG